MTFTLFIQRAVTIIAAFGFAALFSAIMKADEALIANGLLALLPIGICIVLMLRIARQSGQANRKAD